LVYVFFWSSSRRHTRFSRDWSSDVCSSDLEHTLRHLRVLRRDMIEIHDDTQEWTRIGRPVERSHSPEEWVRCHQSATRDSNVLEIGRASCRERVQRADVLCSLEKSDRVPPL